ncbi:MAG: hypothetical protein AAF639_45970 [Chloroflexota bacterium]
MLSPRFNGYFILWIGLSAVIPLDTGKISVSGEPEGLIATGYRVPKISMFAFTEYKRTIDANSDPAGQTLAAMLVGQVLNQADMPVYGCYVVGHDWRFMVLEDNQYTISRDFSAITDEIFDIFGVLKALKLIIMDITATE